MFDNLKISTKMLVLSGVILALLAATLIWAITGLSSTVHNGQEVYAGNALRGELLQREVDHLNWAKQVSNFLTDEKTNELSVQLDHTQCGFGKWYYGNGRQEAEELIPELRGELQALEKPHAQLHGSAKKIKKVYQPADPHLPQFLTEKELDHMNWVYKIQSAILAGENQVKVVFDHTQCGFGKFLYGDKAKHAAAQNPKLAALFDDIKKPHQQLHEHGREIDGLLSAGEQFRASDYFAKHAIPTLNQTKKLLKAAQQEAITALKGQQEAKTIYATETQQNLKEVQGLLRSLAKTSEANILSDAEMVAAATQTRTGVIGIGIAALIIGIFMSLLITRSLTGPMRLTVRMIEAMEQGKISDRLNLQRKDEIGQMASAMDRFADSLENEVVDSLQRLANGDLTFQITPRGPEDSFRNAIQQVGSDLNNIISQIQTAGMQINSASGQVADSSQTLSQGATETAASLEEITSSMSEMASQTTQSAENANQANQLASNASKAAAKGGQQMDAMVAAMTEINEAGQNINKIIKVIDEIAFQTNLLALNAAVEAARAGQHGKGFAVVAEEVRNLAARSAKAASETAELIKGSVEKTQNGTQIAEETSTALHEIVDGITKVTDLVAEIAAASNEQAQGISQVNQGLGQIDQAVQQNTATAEESAAAAEELSSQSEQMKHMLDRFTLAGSQRQFSLSPKITATTELAPNPPAQSAGQPAASFGWGEAQGQQMHKPKPQIQLDDNEFGKY